MEWGGENEGLWLLYRNELASGRKEKHEVKQGHSASRSLGRSGVAWGWTMGEKRGIYVISGRPYMIAFVNSSKTKERNVSGVQETRSTAQSVEVVKGQDVPRS